MNFQKILATERPSKHLKLWLYWPLSFWVIRKFKDFQHLLKSFSKSFSESLFTRNHLWRTYEQTYSLSIANKFENWNYNYVNHELTPIVDRHNLCFLIYFYFCFRLSSKSISCSSCRRNNFFLVFLLLKWIWCAAYYSLNSINLCPSFSKIMFYSRSFNFIVNLLNLLNVVFGSFIQIFFIQFCSY